MRILNLAVKLTFYHKDTSILILFTIPFQAVIIHIKSTMKLGNSMCKLQTFEFFNSCLC